MIGVSEMAGGVVLLALTPVIVAGRRRSQRQTTAPITP
jgi:hypothetical protein